MSAQTLQNIINFVPVTDNIATAGQPTAAQLQAVKGENYELVINLATGKTPRDLPNEADIVIGLGMDYLHLPVVWETPTLDDVARFFEIMQANANKRCFVHCIANMRVSAFVYLYRVLREGANIEQAQQTMHQIWHPQDVWGDLIENALSQLVSKAHILQFIERDWAELQNLLSAISPQAMSEADIDNGWTAKDIVAHISAWEGMMIQWVEASLRGETPNRPASSLTNDGVNALNERLYQAHKNDTVEEVLQTAQEVHTQTVNLVNRLGWEDLADPHRFAWREGRPLWFLVGGNTWLHYQEHIEMIKRRQAG